MATFLIIFLAMTVGSIALATIVFFAAYWIGLLGVYGLVPRYISIRQEPVSGIRITLKDMSAGRTKDYVTEPIGFLEVVNTYVVLRQEVAHSLVSSGPNILVKGDDEKRYTSPSIESQERNFDLTRDAQLAVVSA